MSRSIRRWTVASFVLMVLVYYGIAIFDLHLWRGTGRISGVAAFVSALMAAWYAIFFSRWLRWMSSAINSAMSLDERAELDFARPYAVISAMHKFDVRVRIDREIRRRQPDERDAVMQREAECVAMSLLRIVLPMLTLAYWVYCLCAPAGPMRVGLLSGAVVMTGVAIPVMVLPDLIWLGTEPDVAREPRVVAMDRRLGDAG